MNIDFTSDLHTSFIYQRNKTIFWKNWVLKQKNDYLIIAWDINEDIEILQKSFDDIIENTTYKKIIITFWNHDIWTHKKDVIFGIQNSIEKYSFLKDYFHNYKDKIHVIDVEDCILKDENIVITWNMWWYNYTINQIDKSYLEKYFDANFDKMKFGITSYNDRVYIDFWDYFESNIAFANFLEQELIERLEKIQNNPEYKTYDIFAISHIKPCNQLEKKSPFFKEYSREKWEEIIKETGNIIWKYNLGNIYWNAFFINNHLHEIYKKYGVKYVLYGHTHFIWKENIDGIEYISNALGYYWMKD